MPRKSPSPAGEIRWTSVSMTMVHSLVLPSSVLCANPSPEIPIFTMVARSNDGKNLEIHSQYRCHHVPGCGSEHSATPPRQCILANRQQQQEIGKSKQAKPQL